MSKERYVSYAIAKLLKEKGFDWGCNAHWYIGEFKTFEISPSINPQNWNEVKTDLDWLSCPTQQMACDWLREEHEIDIIPIIRHSLIYAQESPFRDYACRVYDCDGNIVLSATKWYSRYEKAVEAALEYVLTNLI